MSEILQAHLEARVDGVAAEVESTLDEWGRARRGLDNELTRRLGVLSSELALAERRFFDFVGRAPLRDRDQLWRAFRWLRDFDRERLRVEHEVFGLLRQARADRSALMRRLDGRARTLATMGEDVADVSRAAVERSLASGVPAADTHLGRDLADVYQRRFDTAEADLMRRVAAVRSELRQTLERRLPDWNDLDQHLQAAIGSEVRPGHARPTRRRVTAKPARRTERSGKKRKRARVPKFLIKSFYRKGSLRIAGDDVEMTFVNPLAFCIVQNGDPILVDGHPHPAESTVLDNGDKRLLGNALSPDNYLKYPKRCALKVTLTGCRLSPGPHRINLSLELRKMGWIDLNVADEAR